MKTLHSAGTGGMTVLMKKSQNKVLPFPKRPEQPEVRTIVVQIGNERFAIQREIEEWPPAVPLVLRTTCRE